MAKFELGTKVFCFNIGETINATLQEGFVEGIEINGNGMLQYKVRVSGGRIVGVDKNIAETKEEAEQKLAAFKDHVNAQQKLADDFFGSPQFNMAELTAGFPKEQPKM